jgi:glycolate oxidase FAD binding subunit
MDLIHPHTEADVAEALREASAHGRRVLTVGGRHHMDRGNPCEVDAELWTTQLDRVIAYEPAEMLAVVEGGMRCGDLASLLAEHGQEWPVDAPPESTVGGVIAAGVSSTRRLRVGHVRDSVVEMELVTGDGRLIKSGARTVKNVTGYDVHRLATGSLGTLGVIVQVALKVRPLPEVAVDLVAPHASLASVLDLPDRAPAASRVLADPERVGVRLEGWREEVDAARTQLGEFDEGAPPDPPRGASLLEAAVPASRLPEMVAGYPRWHVLAGVGLAWVGVDTTEEVADVRGRAARLGGIAPAVRGPGGLGEAQLGDVQAIHRRLKTSFDPAGVLAPGRFWGGI